MHFSYGFIKDGEFGVCHLHNCTVDDDPDENFRKWQNFFTDPRYRPGETRVLMHFDEECAYLNLAEIQERADFILQFKPARLGIFVWHEIAIETAMMGTSFLRDRGMEARAFDDLDQLFKWMGLG